MKKVLIIGKNGFLGFHLELYFKHHLNYQVLNFNRNDWNNLESFLNEADLIIFNSCIIKGENIFNENKKVIEKFINAYKNSSKKSNVIFVSSSKRLENTDYGKSKLYAENEISKVVKENNKKVKIIITPNIFGPFCKPNYNSAIATFCFNEANQIESNANQNLIQLVYVTDLVKLIGEISLFETEEELIFVERSTETFCYKAEDLLNQVKEIKKDFEKKSFNFNKSSLYKKLYITFLSYINKKDFFIDHKLKTDERGWLFEYNDFDLEKNDHFFISSTNSLKTRGNHFHLGKFEKFTFLKGKMNINFKNLKTNECFSFSIDKFPTTIIIPPFLVHNIVSKEEKEEAIILFYSSEKFDIKNPDTYQYII